MVNEILYYKRYLPEQNIENAIVIPKDLINKIIISYHNSPLASHMDKTKTIKSIEIKYYRPNLIKDVTNFIKKCHECQINKKAYGKTSGYLQHILLPNCRPGVSNLL